MKKILLILLHVVMAQGAWAQQFQHRFDLALPDSIKSTHANSVDLDNDGLPDILLVCKSQTEKSYFLFVKGDTIDTPAILPLTTPVMDVDAFVLEDYDHDNQMDVVVSGMRAGLPATMVYVNRGGFNFEEKPLNLPPFSMVKFSDLDNDARPEIIISGEDGGIFYTRILKQQSELQWINVHDSLRIKATGIEIVDANGDGRHDIFLSGILAPDSFMSGFLINAGSLFFQPKPILEHIGVTTSGDENTDGLFEVWVMGKDNADVPVAEVFESVPGMRGSYTVKELPLALSAADPSVADFNSDGLLDINYYGKTVSNDTINIIQFGDDDYDTLSTRQLLSQQFGDLEHDGDLDLIQVVRNTAIHLEVYENEPAATNLAPGVPTSAVAIKIFDRVFMYWEKPLDDHTPQVSLTYDLHLDGISEYQTGAFDLLNDQRLLPIHGNNGTANFRLLSNMTGSSFGFSIQAVDNSLHGGKQCIGSFDPSAICVDENIESISACSNELIMLESPGDALWFSFAEGFLGTMNGYSFLADRADTLFYYDPSLSGCAGLKTWTVNIQNDTLKSVMSTRFVCRDSEVEFAVEGGWANVEWQSQLRGILGSKDTILYAVTQPDTVVVTLSNSEGCTISRTTAVAISGPILSLTVENARILKGSEVQLGVSGASRYLWSPSTGLNRNDISDPIASPLSSIQYVVMGYDSLDCTDSATVSVIVEGAGFIPNLFTPNDDGKNDFLKVYGMPTVKKFSFSIFNREGSLIFKTTDVSEAVQRGWDGTKNGAIQPPGVYFWKVEGEVTSGEQILLNGKESGSVVLVR
jgi:gliding motility-associated-like protein